ncbi:D-Ala-D-Ala carboxypeptidase family metallohydrolase [Allosphingosinicella indica]|uniref:Peptidase M15 n=1 Tax=Allosphingosinicella indica TaxID=941907 RepID=A0A1X7G062_9SPHN|nr:D-Ala-D-Ala carboxypeptidase family metallohydrolase [Allosphingosinicella indica]SMF61731.1 Peptidase M15 [Allosphingosinicella indica]
MRLPRLLPALTALSLLAAPVAAAESVADGQGEADYHAWLARSPDARAKVIAFRTHLEAQAVADVLPTWQLVRTASMWRECGGPRFEVAPFTEWAHVVKTLKFVRNHVAPVIGPVEAVSGYRNEGLNQCSGGAKESAHRHFFAIDMVPIQAITREAMIRSLCAIHRWRGEGYDIGLGFYSGTRFHVDSKRFRKWGPDGTGATSPCNAA